MSKGGKEVRGLGKKEQTTNKVRVKELIKKTTMNTACYKGKIDHVTHLPYVYNNIFKKKSLKSHVFLYFETNVFIIGCIFYTSTISNRLGKCMQEANNKTTDKNKAVLTHANRGTVCPITILITYL